MTAANYSMVMVCFSGGHLQVPALVEVPDPLMTLLSHQKAMCEEKSGLKRFNAKNLLAGQPFTSTLLFKRIKLTYFNFLFKGIRG